MKLFSGREERKENGGTVIKFIPDEEVARLYDPYHFPSPQGANNSAMLGIRSFLLAVLKT